MLSAGDSTITPAAKKMDIDPAVQAKLEQVKGGNCERSDFPGTAAEKAAAQTSCKADLQSKFETMAKGMDQTSQLEFINRMNIGLFGLNRFCLDRVLFPKQTDMGRCFSAGLTATPVDAVVDRRKIQVTPKPQYEKDKKSPLETMTFPAYLEASKEAVTAGSLTRGLGIFGSPWKSWPSSETLPSGEVIKTTHSIGGGTGGTLGYTWNGEGETKSNAGGMSYGANFDANYKYSRATSEKGTVFKRGDKDITPGVESTLTISPALSVRTVRDPALSFMPADNEAVYPVQTFEAGGATDWSRIDKLAAGLKYEYSTSESRVDKEPDTEKPGIMKDVKKTDKTLQLTGTLDAGLIISARPNDFASKALSADTNQLDGNPFISPSSKKTGFKATGTVGQEYAGSVTWSATGGMNFGSAKTFLGFGSDEAENSSRMEGYGLSLWGGADIDFKVFRASAGYSMLNTSGDSTDNEKETVMHAYDQRLHTVSGSIGTSFLGGEENKTPFSLNIGGRYYILSTENEAGKANADLDIIQVGGQFSKTFEPAPGMTIMPYVAASYSNMSQTVSQLAADDPTMHFTGESPRALDVGGSTLYGTIGAEFKPFKGLMIRGAYQFADSSANEADKAMQFASGLRLDAELSW